MLTGIMYVTVHVTDQERALKFYTEGLGLEKRLDFPGPEGRFLTVGVGDSPVQILLWPRAQGEEAQASAIAALFLESEDLRADFEVFRQRGVEFEQAEPEDYPFGVRIEAVDPDGNRIALRQPLRR
ncbi:VOC family protein [Nonomuraea sp. NPDC050310]|uniref:VOC family protein n=1 Tax=unclassified Nonomuraea TaxID=2593643 RepID=UPI003405203C